MGGHIRGVPLDRSNAVRVTTGSYSSHSGMSPTESLVTHPGLQISTIWFCVPSLLYFIAQQNASTIHLYRTPSIYICNKPKEDVYSFQVTVLPPGVLWMPLCGAYLLLSISSGVLDITLGMIQKVIHFNCKNPSLYMIETHISLKYLSSFL